MVATGQYNIIIYIAKAGDDISALKLYIVFNFKRAEHWLFEAIYHIYIQNSDDYMP